MAPTCRTRATHRASQCHRFLQLLAQMPCNSDLVRSVVPFSLFFGLGSLIKELPQQRVPLLEYADWATKRMCSVRCLVSAHTTVEPPRSPSRFATLSVRERHLCSTSSHRPEIPNPNPRSPHQPQTPVNRLQGTSLPKTRWKVRV